MKFRAVIPALIAGLLLNGCASRMSLSSKITSEPFGKTADGQAVELFTLRNAAGSTARICTYGGRVVSLEMPDRNGRLGDVVQGFDNLDGYLNSKPYFGALIGRYANRIARGRFALNGKSYELATNNFGNSLHGGWRGFDKVVWTPGTRVTADGPSLELRYLSKDGEEGFPGNLNVTAVYTLTDDNALKLEFTATTDADTVVNFTHHSFFNLAGGGDVLNHRVEIPADRFTPVDETLIPTGELRPVTATPFDFCKPTAIGARINADDEQLKRGKGYDHNWVFAKRPGELTLMARVTEPTSGRVMEVFSTAPGMQFYSGNFLDGSIRGKRGIAYEFRSAFCMEPQHFPDSPNQPSFPSTVLRPGQTYRSTIIYRFSVVR